MTLSAEDFIDHLRMPRAVLASRLKTLTAAGVMTRVAGERHLEYELTDKGTALGPTGCSPVGGRTERPIRNVPDEHAPQRILYHFGTRTPVPCPIRKA